MALHDYRKLIDDLHTDMGETFSLAIEVVDPSAARANEGPMIRVEGLTPFGRGFDPVALTVYDAGVVLDAFSGALRAITQPAIPSQLSHDGLLLTSDQQGWQSECTCGRASDKTSRLAAMAWWLGHVRLMEERSR